MSDPVDDLMRQVDMVVVRAGVLIENARRGRLPFYALTVDEQRAIMRQVAEKARRSGR